jgi:hypothetical protein
VEASRAASPTPMEEARGDERALGEDPTGSLQPVPSPGTQQAPSDGSIEAPFPVHDERVALPGTEPEAVATRPPNSAPEDLVERAVARADVLLQEADRLFEELSRASEDLSRGTG